MNLGSGDIFMTIQFWLKHETLENVPLVIRTSSYTFSSSAFIKKYISFPYEYHQVLFSEGQRFDCFKRPARGNEWTAASGWGWGSGGGGRRGGGAAVSRVVQPLWWVATLATDGPGSVSHATWHSWPGWRRSCHSQGPRKCLFCQSFGRSLSLPACGSSLQIIHVGGFEKRRPGQNHSPGLAAFHPISCTVRLCLRHSTAGSGSEFSYFVILLLLQLSSNAQRGFLSRESPCLLSHGGLDVPHQRTSLGGHSKAQGLPLPLLDVERLFLYGDW